MPHRTWIDDDFHAFRASFLSSLTPNIPLQDNLKAVMVPALAKLRRYSKAAVTLHFFVNAFYQEVHALLCGGSAKTDSVVREERGRRTEARDLKPSESLPSYAGFRMSVESASNLFRAQDEEYRIRLGGDLLHLMQDLAKNNPDEFVQHQPRNGDVVIVLPLRSVEYPTLGFFVLWSPETVLREAADNHGDKETRCIFQERLRQVLVRIFTNYYGMAPSTYLPSYYKPGRKKVTLLCAEIRDFSRTWANIELHGGLDFDRKNRCRLHLLDQFGKIAAEAVELTHGRIDQNWGSGLVAVFGEYPATPEGSHRAGLKDALGASSSMSAGFDEYAKLWMKEEFHGTEFHEYSVCLNIDPSIGIAIDWGPVLFDYFGSADHRMFMAVGERVGFVKDLASVAGRIRVEDGLYGLYSDAPTNICWLEEFRGAPILLSQSAWSHVTDIAPVPGRNITLPGRSDRTTVYPVALANLKLKSVKPPE
jgi:class 3 adenylate cyclase